MKEWLEALRHSDNEINNLTEIHVSGTKGKGSTCAFTRSFLRAHGLKTGFSRRIELYTSPHLQSVRERIQIDDSPVPEDIFARYFFEVWDCVMTPDTELDSTVGRTPRYLQLLALLAFHTFVEEKVDAAIFEVHHGGEYDATNVIQGPVVTGIASLRLDPVAQLGPTVETIAWHKAGIFKYGAPAFSVVQEPVCTEVMRSLPTDGRLLSIPVQRLNCSLALELTKAFLRAKAPDHIIGLGDIQHGIEHFSWAGRFEIIEEGNLRWFVDGAHNILSLEQAAKWFGMNVNNSQCRILIFSHLSKARDGISLVQALARALTKRECCKRDRDWGEKCGYTCHGKLTFGWRRSRVSKTVIG
ncbi:Mur ligase [Aspergillus karnatakaensis]|uniref:Mur ligase n=1 Tax=Aspergillus karnatakaensis TaxID=1810916 RepID=UPI003CCE2DED